jgi:hypothetical protein
MVPIVQRQQLVHEFQYELCLLSKHGNTDPPLSLHCIMHQLLSDLERLVRDNCCRGSDGRRQRIIRLFPARTCCLLRYLDSVRQRYICTRLHALELAHTTTVWPSCPLSYMRGRYQCFCNSTLYK